MKIKIPFTNIRIQASHLFIGVIALFTPRLKVGGESTSTCELPSGDYLNSCSDTTIKPYHSIDPNIPSTCEFKTSCSTIFAGLAPIKNTVYFPEDVVLKDVKNNNGTLTYNERPLTTASLSAAEKYDQLSCQKPSGSYEKSCHTQTKKYTSTDPNLGATPLCETEASCYSLKGESSSNIIYFNIKTKEGKTHQKIENCDGYLVAHVKDDRCNNVDNEVINDIARDEGERRMKF